ncbi:hypothetical protein PFLUV_G00002360 [Perca fluviatilis]|uniref:Glycosyl hydrolases family 22 (GH22) domain-containing protein n=1 Tax=Perca fluviatilis TaxID=8168 RepID=A0A6A5FPJ6_PERFL|nr:hypothetical protein PFLUV_G00002360 [Perca fluviatilis]
MKFGLLVVLAVAVLVPSLSEGRNVSRCELREKLGQAITLPPRLQKFKQQYLATVICEVNSRSRLNTGLVKVPIPTGATKSTLGTNGTRAGNNRRKRDASSEELLNEDDAEEGGKRKKRSSKEQSSEETKQSSLGLYGIFQLSDETFCNSGYHSSKNKCNTTCDAFTDDNIMDDIDCLVKTDQWR